MNRILLFVLACVLGTTAGLNARAENSCNETAKKAAQEKFEAGYAKGFLADYGYAAEYTVGEAKPLSTVSHPTRKRRPAPVESTYSVPYEVTNGDYIDQLDYFVRVKNATCEVVDIQVATID